MRIQQHVYEKEQQKKERILSRNTPKRQRPKSKRNFMILQDIEKNKGSNL